MSAKAHKEAAASVGCLLGLQGYPCMGRVELHHVAEGSGLRNDYAMVPLCSEHHRGAAGLHGMGSKKFITLYRPPGDSEYGLLVWLNEALAKRRGERGPHNQPGNHA